MHIQVIDEHGVLLSDHPVGVCLDPDHGFCDLCEKPTPVLFDVTIYPADDYPILRCHGCTGDGSPGERLVGAATARLPGGGDIYIIDPHGYLRLPADQVRSVAGELAEHLVRTPARARPPDRPLWPRLAQLADDLAVSVTAAGRPAPPAGDGAPPPEPAPVATTPPAAGLSSRAEIPAFGGPTMRGSAGSTWFEVVGPDTRGSRCGTSRSPRRPASGRC